MIIERIVLIVVMVTDSAKSALNKEHHLIFHSFQNAYSFGMHISFKVRVNEIENQ